MRAELNGERERRLNLERCLDLKQKEFEEDKMKFDSMESKWKMEREQFLQEKEELQFELEEVCSCLVN